MSYLLSLASLPLEPQSLLAAAGGAAALLSGVRSAQSEPAGWNAIVVPALQELNVARTGTLVLVTIPRVPTYDITAPETISLTLPPASSVSAASFGKVGEVGADSKLNAK